MEFYVDFTLPSAISYNNFIHHHQENVPYPPHSSCFIKRGFKIPDLWESVKKYYCDGNANRNTLLFTHTLYSKLHYVLGIQQLEPHEQQSPCCLLYCWTPSLFRICSFPWRLLLVHLLPSPPRTIRSLPPRTSAPTPSTPLPPWVRCRKK